MKICEVYILYLLNPSSLEILFQINSYYNFFLFTSFILILSKSNKFCCPHVYDWADLSCFQGLFFCPEAFSLLLHNFCIYHISPPGHEVCNLVTSLQIVVLLYIYIFGVCVCWFFRIFCWICLFCWIILSIPFLIWDFLQELLQLGADAVSLDEPALSADDLADQIAEVLNFFG